MVIPRRMQAVTERMISRIRPAAILKRVLMKRPMMTYSRDLWGGGGNLAETIPLSSLVDLDDPQDLFMPDLVYD